MKNKEDTKIQNLMLIIIVAIVVTVVVGMIYYTIREKQNKDSNEASKNIFVNETSLNGIGLDTTDKEETEDVISKDLTIIKTISPSGFAGASNYNLCLYSDKTVYFITYNGNGYTEKDISSKELLAEEVEDIYYDETEEILYIVGGNKLSDSGMSWIKFK